MPERFAPKRKHMLARGAYLPFGHGPRICIGQGFAIQEMLTVLAIVLRGFSLKLSPATCPTPVARITLQPSPSMPIVLEA
jgi:cytochrome P450